MNFYDRCGHLIEEYDVFEDGAYAKKYGDEWYVVGEKDTMWNFDQFCWDCIDKENVRLVDFEVIGKVDGLYYE